VHANQRISLLEAIPEPADKVLDWDRRHGECEVAGIETKVRSIYDWTRPSDSVRNRDGTAGSSKVGESRGVVWSGKVTGNKWTSVSGLIDCGKKVKVWV
jgi:hypothetical protein